MQRIVIEFIYMENIYELIKQRRSVRNFKPDPVDEAVLKRIVEAALWAPSAGNVQARMFYLVLNPHMKKAVASACFDQEHVEQAPAVIVACTDVETMRSFYGKRGTTLYGICDVSAAVENMLLAAWSEGVGSCWVGNFDEHKLQKALNIPKQYLPVAVVPLGYPSEVPPPPARKSFDESVIIL